MKEEITEDFALNDPPVNEGVYALRMKGISQLHFSRWYKGHWRYTCNDVDDAAKQTKRSPSCNSNSYQYIAWFGLLDKS